MERNLIESIVKLAVQMTNNGATPEGIIETIMEKQAEVDAEPEMEQSK